MACGAFTRCAGRVCCLPGTTYTSLYTWFGRSRRWEPEVLQKGRDNWNQPLWRQSKGPSWLFSSPDGFWRFANNDLETWEAWRVDVGGDR